jgi:hypothetical protein
VCGSWVGDDGIGFVECDGVTLYKWMGVVQGGICGTSIIMASFSTVYSTFTARKTWVGRVADR